MDINLTAIEKYCAENIGGLRSIEYASTAWIDIASYDERISSTYNKQADIVFTTQGWKKLPILSGNNKVWTESEVQTAQGKYYQQTVNCITPKLRPTVSGEFMKMRDHRYLIRLTDKNNQKWLLGTLETPFRLLVTATTSENEKGYNNYQIQFTSQTSSRAVGFNPVF